MWQGFVIISTIFFVAGQVLLKLTTTDATSASVIFMMAMGATALLYGVTMKREAFLVDKKTLTLITMAGVAFFIGNFLWIKAIKNVDNIGFVRILMAGLEIALLLLVALLIFKKKTSLKVIVLTFIGCGLLVYASIIEK